MVTEPSQSSGLGPDPGQQVAVGAGHRDIDAFIRDHKGHWDRLGALTSRAGRRPAKLSATELDELVRLYQRVSAHLSYARTHYRDQA
ncbi:MAG: hypothetical protein ACRDRT_11125, partial [Pseudonocardiaceae bacterium]